jgi:hypothetical protein
LPCAGFAARSCLLLSRPVGDTASGSSSTSRGSAVLGPFRVCEFRVLELRGAHAGRLAISSAAVSGTGSMNCAGLTLGGLPSVQQQFWPFAPASWSWLKVFVPSARACMGRKASARLTCPCDGSPPKCTHGEGQCTTVPQRNREYRGYCCKCATRHGYGVGKKDI